MKKIALYVCLSIFCFQLHAQKAAENQILVLFRSGISPDTKKMPNGKFGIIVKSTSLQNTLSTLGIPLDAIESANPNFKESDTLKTLDDGSVLTQFNMKKFVKINVPAGKTAKEVIEALQKMPEVIYAESNAKGSTLAIPSDTRYSEQWGLKNNTTAGADIHIEPVWNMYTGDPTSYIGIIDSGVETAHLDLNDKVMAGENGTYFDNHGTLVSGVAAAESNNAQGISGVDWLVKIHPQKTNFSDVNDIYNSIVNAVTYNSRVYVLNNSYGLVDGSGQYGTQSTTVRSAIAYAYKANRTFVAAAGNSQVTQPDVTVYPAGYDNVLSVGASDINDNVLFFSTHTPTLDVVAPGQGILSTTIGGTYANFDGTSMSTPFVSGIASLMKGYKPSLANDDIINIIRLSADDKGTPGFDNLYGTGRVNAEKAFSYLQVPYSIAQNAAASGTTYSSTAYQGTTFYAAGALGSGAAVAKKYEVRKTVTFPKSYCQIVSVWGRGVGTNGWSPANPNFGEGFTDIVPGTLTSTGCTLRTYVYEVTNINGQYLGFYPTTVANATFAYTVLGIENPSETIAGDFPSPSCANATQTFSIVNPVAGALYTWTTSPGLQIVGANTGTSVLVKVIGNAIQTVTYSTPNLCNATYSFLKIVSVGIPGLNVVTSDDRTVQSGNYTYHTATCTQIANTSSSNYNWYNQTSGGVLGSLITTGLQLNRWPIPPCSGKYYQLQLAMACGTAYYNGYAYNTYGCGGPHFAASPNPAIDKITVKVSKELKTVEVASAEEALKLINSNYADGEPFEAILYDLNGSIVATIAPGNDKNTIDTKSLPRGIYLLQFKTRSGTQTQRIFLER